MSILPFSSESLPIGSSVLQFVLHQEDELWKVLGDYCVFTNALSLVDKPDRTTQDDNFFFLCFDQFSVKSVSSFCLVYFERIAFLLVCVAMPKKCHSQLSC